jgi:hypothetical protein
MVIHSINSGYEMLLLHGPSRTGKSRLARSLNKDEHTLVVDIQHAKHPDLHDFSRANHAAVLLDEMSGPDFIVENKKLLQAHVDGAILGQSATQLYTYMVWLWRIPIMITTNNWDLRKMKAADREWLATNVVDVYIDSPVWQDVAECQTEEAENEEAASRTPTRQHGIAAAASDLPMSWSPITQVSDLPPASAERARQVASAIEDAAPVAAQGLSSRVWSPNRPAVAPTLPVSTNESTGRVWSVVAHAAPVPTDADESWSPGLNNTRRWGSSSGVTPNPKRSK